MSTAEEMRLQAYEVIANNPNILMPEFDFTPSPFGWKSGNYRKLDGQDSSEKGKIAVYSDQPGMMYSFKGEIALSFYDYLVNYRGLDNKEAYRALLDAAGIVSGKHTTPNIRGIHPDITNALQDLFTKTLLEDVRSSHVLQYLNDKRKYDADMIKDMGLGAMPPRAEMAQYLKDEGTVESKYIKFFISSLRDNIENTNPLTIPCYGRYGRLEGHVYRAASHSSKVENKYINSYKMNRNDGILNVDRKTKSLLIVEGILDALVMKHIGIEYAVSCNGSRLNESQLKAIEYAGIEDITLMLDNDQAGKNALRRMVDTILTIKPGFDVFIVDSVVHQKDPDELVRSHGKTIAPRNILYMHHKAMSLGEWIADNLICGELKGKANLTTKQRRGLEKRVSYFNKELYRVGDHKDMYRTIIKHMADELFTLEELRSC